MMRNKTKIYLFLVATVLLFRVNSLAQPAGAGAKSSERPTGAISGRVINSAGEPLAGASVSASTISGGRSQAVTVNSNGEFKIDGLEPGLYRLFSLMTGYVSSTPPSATDPVYSRIGDSVTLTLIKGAVITGTVTGTNGPLVSVGVFVTRVRDEAGKTLPPLSGWRERSTDDRGMFRIYGLQPGTYIVWAAKRRLGLIIPSAFDNDAPTYFPSGTRDTATEITVRDGEEITTDIQYRAEPGHAVSGHVTGVIESQERFSPGASINLVDVQRRTSIPGTSTNSADNNSFALYGVPDGEYELYAIQYLPTGDGFRSPPQRVSVRGGDVTGLNVTLAPLGSIEGRLVFETDPKAGCAQRKETAAPETIVKAWRSAPEKTDANNKPGSSEVSTLSANAPTLATGDAKGSFLLRNLQPGNYQIDSQPPASGWYLKSMATGTTRAAAAKTAGLNPARDGIALKSGERVTGVIITIAEGAARLRGRISVAEGQSLPPRMTVYLVPSEPGAADNVLRFYEARSDADGRFTLDEVAPGKYWIVARPWEQKESETAKAFRKDAVLRAKVLQEAEALKKVVALKPCEQAADFDLPFVPSTSQR
jgi:hypothetical protein